MRRADVLLGNGVEAIVRIIIMSTKCSRFNGGICLVIRFARLNQIFSAG